MDVNSPIPNLIRGEEHKQFIIRNDEPFYSGIFLDERTTSQEGQVNLHLCVFALSFNPKSTHRKVQLS